MDLPIDNRAILVGNGLLWNAVGQKLVNPNVVLVTKLLKDSGLPLKRRPTNLPITVPTYGVGRFVVDGAA